MSIYCEKCHNEIFWDSGFRGWFHLDWFAHPRQHKATPPKLGAVLNDK